MKKYFLGILFILGVLGLVACGKGEGETTEMTNETTYKRITMEEAREIFEKEGDYVIVDVRRKDEYDSGHIPNAINIPNESIQDFEIAELPDKEQVIYVYCRSGNRSKQAAQKLVDQGYTNIVEFGGIMDWTGDIE
ncbi:MAG: rhodanese-like domain-containing protein [Agathobacter sp.]|nr:rhodanese-like domain-containing protein [Agathobacter sp.]